MNALDLAASLFAFGYIIRTAIFVLAATVQSRETKEIQGGLSISVVIPAKDEEKVIVDTVRSALAAAIRANVAQIIVVDDGSTDGTLAEIRSMGDIPGLIVISHFPNRGKASALNVALEHATGDVLVTVDADTDLERDALVRIAAPFADHRVIAVAGNVKVRNRGAFLQILQSIEYIGSLAIDRRAQDLLASITTVPGAFGAWRVDSLKACDGFPPDTLSEDTDLTLAVGISGGRIVYAADAIAWTEAPDTLAGLFRQRARWLRGNLQCLARHGPAWYRAPAGYFFLGLPDFAWRQAGAFITLSLALIWLLSSFDWLAGAAPFVAGFAALLLLDVAVLFWAHRLDNERFSLTHGIVWRLLWPWFLLAVFILVATRIVFRRPSQWARVARRGR